MRCRTHNLQSTLFMLHRLFAIVCCAASAFAVLQASSEQGLAELPVVRASAVGIVAACMFDAASSVFRLATRGVPTPVSVLLAYTGIAYFFPVATGDDTHALLNPTVGIHLSSIGAAPLLYASACIGSGFLILWRFERTTGLEQPFASEGERPIGADFAELLYGLTFAASVGAQYVVAIRQPIEFLWRYFLVLSVQNAIRGRSFNPRTILFLAFLSAHVVVEAARLVTWPIITIIVFLLLGAGRARVRFRPAPIVAAGAVLFLFQSAKNDLRVDYGVTEAGVSVVSRAGDIGIRLLERATTLTDDANIKGDDLTASEMNAQRLNHLIELEIVTSAVPEIVPYSGFETLLPLLVKPIPRLLWPDKPAAELGQWFGHRFGIIARFDTDTAVNLMAATEGFVAFGYGGVVLFVGFLAIALRVSRYLTRVLREDRDATLSLGLGITLTQFSLGAEASVAEALGSLIVYGGFALALASLGRAPTLGWQLRR